MTDVFGAGRHVTAHLPERPGDSQVVIDGVDVTRAVSGLRLDAWGEGRAVTVHLDMRMVEVASVDAHNVNVLVSVESTELLTGAGWVPPAVADAITPVLLRARQWASGECLFNDLAEAVGAYERAVNGAG